MSKAMTTEEMLCDLDKHYQGQMTEWQEMFVANQIDNLRCAEAEGFIFQFTKKQAMKIAEIYAEKDEEM